MRRSIVALVGFAACSRGAPEPSAPPPAPVVVDAALALADAAPAAIATVDAAPAVAAAPADARHADRSAPEELAEAMRFADVLVAGGDALPMSDRHPGADLNAQLRDSPDRGARAPSSSPAPPSGPSGRITMKARTALDDTSLTGDAVLAKITSSYLLGLKRCYQRGLATDPGLRGELHLAFTVGPTGRATGEATMTSEAVASCVTTVLQTWQFAIPKRGDAPVEARFTVTMRLDPA